MVLSNNLLIMQDTKQILTDGKIKTFKVQKAMFHTQIHAI